MAPPHHLSPANEQTGKDRAWPTTSQWTTGKEQEQFSLCPHLTVNGRRGKHSFTDAINHLASSSQAGVQGDSPILSNSKPRSATAMHSRQGSFARLSWDGR
jgi:hypothetical protein